jgi:hypothetical protein
MDADEMLLVGEATAAGTLQSWTPLSLNLTLRGVLLSKQEVVKLLALSQLLLLMVSKTGRGP